jgi:type VI secretion system protein ImpJ
MDPTGLALHRWRRGQILTPEHFKLQEQALLGHIALRSSIHGLPAYGISNLRFRAGSLEAGSPVVESLGWVLRDGRLVSLPGNVRRIASEPLAGRDPSLLCLHLIELDGDVAEAREASAIEPSLYDLLLSARHAAATGEPVSETLPLCSVENQGGAWTARAFAPPLLQVGTSPFLREALARIALAVQASLVTLERRIAPRYVRGEALGDLLREKLAGERVLALLDDCGVSGAGEGGDEAARPRLHPYLLFDALRAYCLELGLPPERPPLGEPLRYDHERLGPLFERIADYVVECTRVEPAGAHGLRFERRGPLYVVENLPIAELGSVELILSLRGEATEAPKLASPRRLEIVSVNALSGIGLTPVGPPALLRSVAPGQRFYRIERNGEWRFAAEERALAFRRVPGVALDAELLWSNR